MGSPINRQFHLDNQGSALDLTTATGSIEAAYHTDAWGNVISGTAADNPYIYLGGLGYWQEGALNLNYVRARWQEVSTGSWLSVDSVRTQPRYQYASNSPTRLVDPSGMDDGKGFWDKVDDVMMAGANILVNMPVAAKEVYWDSAVRVYHLNDKARLAAKAVNRIAPRAATVLASTASDFVRGLVVLGVYDQANTFWVWLRQHILPRVIADLLPDTVEQFPEFTKGFIEAFVQALVDAVLPAESIQEIFNLVKVLVSAPERLWALIWDVISRIFTGIFHLIVGHHKSGYERGRDFGTIFVFFAQLALPVVGEELLTADAIKEVVIVISDLETAEASTIAAHLSGELVIVPPTHLPRRGLANRLTPKRVKEYWAERQRVFGEASAKLKKPGEHPRMPNLTSSLIPNWV